MKTPKYTGYLISFIALIAMLILLGSSWFHHWRMPGPLNTGHEELDCRECHEETQSSFRQEIQANLQYFLGKRKTGVAFNLNLPDNHDCVSCHSRDDDNHPVYRFNEPRFKEVRSAISPQHCVSCHREHSGVRVTSEADNCKECHEDIDIKIDPLEVSHAELVLLENWSSCLRCHDFHGNHDMTVTTDFEQMKSLQAIERYFEGGVDPYSEKKRTSSKTTRYAGEKNNETP